MQNERTGAKIVRALVKTIFILCYGAFMWASIHHVAVFFNNFEQSNDSFGSYLLAGAFDVTALVTTIGVMFFRKSMPRSIQAIVWVFIVAIAAYSFFINWEYTSHFQSAALTLQPTGQTTPVMDAQGGLHYVPVMVQNTTLLYVNPALASGFTIFSLIYSVIAEFFGTKAPSADELAKRKTYLEETAGLLEDIKKLEDKGKGPGWIQRGKQAAIELKTAVKEVTKQEDSPEETAGQTERNTDKLTRVNAQAIARKEEETGEGSPEETANNAPRQTKLSEAESIIASYYEKCRSWLAESESTVSLKTVSETMNVSMKLLHNRVASKMIRATKNKEIVYKASVVAWAINEIIPADSQKIIRLKAVRNEQETGEEIVVNRA